MPRVKIEHVATDADDFYLQNFLHTTLVVARCVVFYFLRSFNTFRILVKTI